MDYASYYNSIVNKPYLTECMPSMNRLQPRITQPSSVGVQAMAADQDSDVVT